MSQHHTQKNQNSQPGSESCKQDLLPGQPISGVFNVYKSSGETLATLVRRFRVEENLSENIPVTYAGRLDPMAEGLVLLLVGETCKEKEQFLGLNKTYVFEVLFGVATDTFDMLGLITNSSEVNVNVEGIEKVLPTIQKQKTFSYPSFSSKPFEGQPLFVHAKAGTLPNNLPKLEGQIKSLVLKDFKKATFGSVVNQAIETIKKVEGDFRQDQSIESWQKFLAQKKDTHCVLATFEAEVSSGVYIRTIATLIGQALNTPALAYSIKRSKIGEYK